ncbi:MAG: aminoacyl-histidine dipeptidase [Ruminococcaceae bacterium]|nr:aminoacyl-histidine dipeptidase [Oscillospiraceae bacterium]
MKVLDYFKEICKIPHGSGNTKAIADYCINFAKEQGFEYYTDALNNVIIYAPGTVGFENHKPVILQGHLDMVCEKTEDKEFDFYCDSLELRTEGDFLYATDTTLGADNGIAVAMILTLLADKTAQHPPIEAVFTTDEEIGMFGAKKLDVTKLSSTTLINLDSDSEGVLIVSCAGGAKVDIHKELQIEYVHNVLKSIDDIYQNAEKQTEVSGIPFRITVSGLKGGHSGIEINKGRLNSNKVMAAFLGALKANGYEVRFATLNGGFKDNAIPTNTSAIVFLRKPGTNSIVSLLLDVMQLKEKFVEENNLETDLGLDISIKAYEPTIDTLVANLEDSTELIDFLIELPDGVQKMSADIKNLPETSLNLGVLKISQQIPDGYLPELYKQLKIDSDMRVSVRSSKKAEKEALLKKIEELANKRNAKFSVSGSYPAWEYRKDSPLRGIMVSAYRDLFGKEPEIKAIHAGLECGLFADKIENLDCVSFGPDLFDIHTPREHLSISSAERTYKYLLEVLKRL